MIKKNVESKTTEQNSENTTPLKNGGMEFVPVLVKVQVLILNSSHGNQNTKVHIRQISLQSVDALEFYMDQCPIQFVIL